MINCKPYGTTFLKPYTCIHKQTELAEILKKMEIVGKRKTGAGTSEIITNTPPVRYFALKKCHGCEVGLELYRKHKNGELSMDTQTKKCPCGAVITRWEGQNDMSWARVKYCPEHAGMGQYQRDKLFKKQPAVTPKKTESTPVKKDPVKTFRCSVCKKEKELNPDNFHSNTSHSTNFDSTCRVCRNEKKRAARGTGAFVVKLDFTNHQELFEKLQEKAEGQLRTIENQALWDMIRALDAFRRVFKFK